MRIPPGVEDGQRIRLASQGEAGLRGAPSGDLYVTVHVKADKVFGRDGDDLTVTIPVSFSELALGSTLSVPTLEGKVGVRVPRERRTAASSGCAAGVCQALRWTR